MRIPRANGIVSNRQTSTGQIESGQTQQAVGLFSTAMGFVQKYNEEKDRSQIQEAINTATKKTNEWKVNNLSRTGKDAQGLTEEFLQFNQEVESELSGNLSRNAKSAFNEWNIRNSENDKMGVMLHQKKQDDFVKQSAFNDGLNIVQETFRTDAKNHARGFDHLESTLELGRQSGVIKEEEFEKTKADLTNKFRTELGKNYYTQDKHEFMREINNFGFGEPEKAYYKDKYQNDLDADEREKKSLFNEEAKLLFGKRDDMKAQAVANGDTSHFFESAQKLKNLGYAEWAGQLEEDGNLYKSVVTFNEQNKARPLGERMQAANNLSVGQDLDGSSIEFKSMQAIQGEVKKEAKIFHADPAEYVNSLVVGDNDEQRAASRLSLQEKQGLMPKDGFKVLTQNEKTYTKAAWDSGTIQNKTEIIKETFKYGKYAPKVISELGVNKSLALVPLLDNEQDIELFVAGVSEDKSVILDDSTLADYKSANKGSDFHALMTDVQATFPTNEDLPSKMADMDKAMTGISARKVNKSAGPEFFDRNFGIINDGDKKIYFPKTVDEDDLEELLNKKKQEITSKMGTNSISKMALRDAVWVNTQSGFTLADPKSGRALPDADVELLEVDELRKEMARKAKVENPYSSKLSFNRR